MSVPTTPNLGLNLAPFDYSSSPNWSALLNQNFTIIDGLGAQVVSSDIDINADLSFNGFSATNLTSTQYQSQGSALSPSLLSTLYSVGGNLYWTDGAGNQIALTAGGSPTGGPSDNGFSGADYSSSFAAFTLIGGIGSFFFTQAANTYAEMNQGRTTIYDDTQASPSRYVTLQVPASGTFAYVLTLPPTPGGISTASALLGTNISAVTSWIQPDNSTINISGGLIFVKSGGITGTQLAAGSVSTTNLTSGAVTLAKLGSIPTPQSYGYTQTSGTSISNTQAGRYNSTSFTVTAASTPFGAHAGFKVEITLPTSLSNQDIITTFSANGINNRTGLYIDEFDLAGTSLTVWFGCYSLLGGGIVDIGSGVWSFAFSW